jgi:hypothetical protein
MLTLVTKVKAAKRAQLEAAAGVRLKGSAICDGCRERLFRNGIERATLYQAADHPKRRKTDNWNGRAAAAMEWVWRVATVLLVPMLLWISVTLIAIDKRVTVIEASRFTVTGAAAYP